MTQPTVAVLGLGYVGLPVAVAFASRYDVIGYDVKAHRVAELRDGIDVTLEVPAEELLAAQRLRFTSDPVDLAAATVYVVTVPTPIDDAKRPDLGPLRAASRTVGAALSVGDTVVYESTVYPGATEEVCVPILEAESGLRFNTDFTVGYSPERINPGDTVHRITDIRKVTSGSTPEAADFIDELYASVITAGTHRASSIRVAEAAKVIENTQRDVNIALINELAVLFNQLGLNTLEVLQAAGTKWNFLPFRPGLVGGHCIGVDPYYLTYKAQQVGHHPEVILAGRRINDAMGAYVADQFILAMARRGLPLTGARVLVLGPGVQGELPRPAQHPRRGHRGQAGGLRPAGGRVRPVGGRRRGEGGVRPGPCGPGCGGARGLLRGDPGGAARAVPRCGAAAAGVGRRGVGGCVGTRVKGVGQWADARL